MKRLLILFLVAAMVCTGMPTQTYAKTSGNMYGDADGNKVIDLKDLLALKKYISEEKTSDFEFVNADVNSDGSADLKDLLMLKKYLAEWDIHLGPELLTVSFYDGDNIIDVLPAEMNYPLGELPTREKAAKDNAVLLDYYIDKEFTTPFYAEDPVKGNTDVYAKYQEMGGKEELNITSFAQMDQSPDMTFRIKQVSGKIPVNEAVTLDVKDGSDPVALKVENEGNGIYTVSAPEGFHEGCSYELNLADGWVFDGKEETIRTASFSIAMKEVENLEMNDDIKYIKDTDEITYSVNGTSYDVLTSEQVNDNGGTFEYDKVSELEVEDIICLYVGVKPTERNTENGSELMDPAVYVKVSEIKGNKVTFAGLDENDQLELYKMPDNFPLVVSELPTEETGTVSLDAIDLDIYANMMGDDGTYENAVESIEAGDFVSMYISTDEIASSDDVYYGEITSYDKTTKTITYKKTTETAIEESMNLYSELSVSGSDFVTDEECEQLESVLSAQMEESNFGEEAAEILCDMVTKTDGFRKNMSVQDYLLTDEQGKPLSKKKMKQINLAKGFELTDDVKLKLELINKGDQLHFNNGIQLAVGVEAEFEVEVEEGTIKIELSATFVEECELVPRVKGEVVTKKILFIPVPIGVGMNATIDIKNFTAFSFNANIYTVGEDDKSLWEKFKSIAEDPTEALGLAGLPDGLKTGLKSVKDVMGKIEEVQNKIDQANATVEQIKGYQEDLEELWKVMEKNGTAQEQWEEMCETFEKSNVASDVLGLMDMSTDTELSTEFLDGMQGLMDKYSETIQKETDWVTLVNKEICTAEMNYYGIVIGTQINFLVRADLNIAIGSNLEYEVGKRYNFWFKVGLFTPSAGSSTMDLLDERFDFQFYVMGKVGLKAGIRAKLFVGIGSAKFASVGITAELGPYIKLYGFFIYEYSKYRPANSQNTTSKERMAGALYLEFGLYFMLGFEANALGDLFEYSHDFLDEEVPLVTAGRNVFYYNTAYEPSEDEVVVVRDEDANSTNGITMDAPKDIFGLSYVEMNTGIQGTESLDFSNYNVRFTNRNFSFNKDTGKIEVNVPEKTRYIKSDMVITYLYSKVAFSQYDMTVTVPVIWTNLSDEELNEYYTASVRVGNDTDGYKTVWSEKVRKNQEFDLPTDDELKEIIDWSDYKYIETTGYGDQQTEKLTIIDNMTYDYNVDYQTYSIKVDGIENADGTTKSKTFHAKYGEAFDFSSLESTGANRSDIHNKFAGVTTTATIYANGEEQVIDLTQPINQKTADALNSSITAKANYVDDSVTATYVFNGIDVENATVKVKRGTVPNYDFFAVAEENNTDVIGITPEVKEISSTTTYYVECRNVIKKLVTITFDTNGGSIVEPITRKETTILPAIPVPAKRGYIFDGWCTDPWCNNRFTSSTVPTEDITLYAKWKPASYIVTFHVNGGNELEQNTKKVTYDSTYGELPVLTRTNYAFLGWFTEIDGGVEVKASDKVSITSSQTLYAHWRKLKEIPIEVFDFGEIESFYYDSNLTRAAKYTFTAESGETYTEDSFSFKYKAQDADEYVDGLPYDVGVYDILVSRPMDDYYLKFEQLYTGVLIIKAYEVNCSYYRVYVDCEDTVGGSQVLNNTVSWSDGKNSQFSLEMNTSKTSGSISRYGTYPTQIHLKSNKKMGGQHVWLSTKVYDLAGNCHTVKNRDKDYWYNPVDRTWNLGSYPVVDYSKKNCEVSKNGKIKVQLDTYGNSGKLSALTYSTSSDGSNSAEGITIDGNYFIIDGSKITDGQTIKVYAKYNNGSFMQVGEFTVSHLSDSE